MSSLYDRDYASQGAVKAQSNLTTAADFDGAAAFLYETLTLTPAVTNIPVAENRATREIRESVSGAHGPHTFNVLAAHRPYGLTPDILPFLDGMFVIASRSAIANADISAATSTTLTVADKGDYIVGDLIGIPAPSGYTLNSIDREDMIHVRRITDISTVSGNDVITFTSAVPFTPSTSKDIPACKLLKPRDTVDTTKYVSVARYDDNAVHTISGALAGEFDLTVEAEGIVKLTIGGMGRDMQAMSYATLDGDINSSVTSIDVSDGAKFQGISSDRPIHFKIGDEVIKCTGVSNDTLTVVRGQKSTSAASHADGDALVPYVPTPTTAGTCIAGHLGLFEVDGEAVDCTTFSFNNNENFTPIGPVTSSDKVVDFIGAANRTTSVSATTTARREYHQYNALALARSEVAIGLQAGLYEGTVLAAHLPRVKLAPQGVQSQPEDRVGISIQSDQIMGLSTVAATAFQLYMG